MSQNILRHNHFVGLTLKSALFALVASGTLAVSESAFAQDTSLQVNRAKKTSQLPRSQWGLAAKASNWKQGGKETKSPPPAKVEKKPAQVPSALTVSSTADNFAAPITNVPIKKGLSAFYKALSDLKTGARTRPVTILHLGDDHIARDRFSGDLRDLLQARFGDSGRGMIMPGPVFPFFRAKGMRIETSGKWNSANAVTSDSGIFGLTGASFSTSDPKAYIQMSSSDDKPFSWAEVTFMTGPENGRAIMWVLGADKTPTNFKGSDDALQQIVETNSRQYGIRRIPFPNAATSLSIFPEGDKPITILSWRTGIDRPGVRYINIGLPKATAEVAQKLDADFVQSDLENINPDLVILGYGTNESFNQSLNIVDYQTQFSGFLRSLRTLAPNASFMVIGPPDIAFLPPFARSGATSASKPCRALDLNETRIYDQLLRSGDARLGRWHPPLKLNAVRQAMRRTAEASSAYFWDWSKIMGGPCGIHTWVHNKPKLAADNHRTFTDEGARRSARSLYSELMNGFESFQRQAKK